MAGLLGGCFEFTPTPTVKVMFQPVRTTAAEGAHLEALSTFEPEEIFKFATLHSPALSGHHVSRGWLGCIMKQTGLELFSNGDPP
jgi:hypothetical protein